MTSTKPFLRRVMAFLLLIVLMLFAASILVGPAGTGLPAFFRLMNGGEGETAVLILREIRLPRALLAGAIGAALGLSGAALQGFLRNPLAEPGVIGIGSTAALGAVLALYTGLSSKFPLALPLAAIAGAMVAVLTIQALGARHGTVTLILAGVAISSLGGALTSLALNLSPNPFAAQEIIFWMLGSVTDRSMVHAGLALPFITVGAVLLLLTGRQLEALTLGEETAISMGIDLGRTRSFIVLGTALSVGAATAVSGVIGFIGLIVPHVLRPFVGHRPSLLLPASALGGAALLLAADILVRIITPGTELKLGVVTALLGAPFFLWLVLSSRKSDFL